MDQNFLPGASVASAWVEAGGYELNVAGVCGAPTLRPSPGLERRLTLDLAGGSFSMSTIKLGVHLHAFYLMEAEHIICLLQQVLPPFDLLITTDTTDKQHSLGATLARFASPPWQQRLEIRVVPNRGRNIVPLLRDGVPFLDNCQLVLHLHTKRTTHKRFGSDWLDDLLACLIGNADSVGALIQSFITDPDLGLVMPLPSEHVRPYLNWGANFEIASLLVHTLWPGRSLNLQSPLVFPPGMMFWARPAALAPLAGALAALESLAPEPMLNDGTPIHALERLMAHACEVAGLRWALAGTCSIRRDPLVGTSTALPLKVSVWEPQPEAYLECVAALGANHRQLQHSLEERNRQLQTILDHRDSLEMSLLERDKGLIERDVALSECQQELLSNQNTQRRQLLINLEQAKSFEVSLADCDASLRALKAEQLAMSQSRAWRLADTLRRLSAIFR